MLGIDIVKLMGSPAPAGEGILLISDFAEDVQYNGNPSSAFWDLSGNQVITGPNASTPIYTWLSSGDPADYEVVIAGSGFTTGAAGTYSCDTGVTLTVSRTTQGITSANFTASIQLAANPGVFLASASITIRARTFNGDPP